MDMPAYDLERSLGFLLNDVSRLMRQRFNERARDLGLTRAQWRVLGHLRRYEGITQSSLAEILEVENVTLGRHIDRLEDAGWVERRPDPSDRRVWRLHLDQKSRPIIDRLNHLSSEVREEAMNGFSRQDRENLIDTLLALKENLAAMGNGVDGKRTHVGQTNRDIEQQNVC
jgi:MarR family transcriptional regulator for hemolysin